MKSTIIYNTFIFKECHALDIGKSFLSLFPMLFFASEYSSNSKNIAIDRSQNIFKRSYLSLYGN